MTNKPITLKRFSDIDVPVDSLPDQTIIGLETETHTKYIISCSKNSVGFTNGNRFWSRADTIDELLQDISNDTRNKLQLYYFDSLQELACWLNKQSSTTPTLNG